MDLKRTITYALLLLATFSPWPAWATETTTLVADTAVYAGSARRLSDGAGGPDYSFFLREPVCPYLADFAIECWFTLETITGGESLIATGHNSTDYAMYPGFRLVVSPAHATDCIATYLENAEHANIFAKGTAQSATSSTIVLSQYETFKDDDLNTCVIEIIDGTGSGYSRAIDDYVAATKTCTISPDWSVTPDATSVYIIRRPIQNDTTGNYYPSGGAYFQADTWHHLIVLIYHDMSARNGSVKAKAWVDGVAWNDDTATLSALSPITCIESQFGGQPTMSTLKSGIGQSNTGGTADWPGSIAHFRYWEYTPAMGGSDDINTLFDQDMIDWLYNSGNGRSLAELEAEGQGEHPQIWDDLVHAWEGTDPESDELLDFRFENHGDKKYGTGDCECVAGPWQKTAAHKETVVKWTDSTGSKDFEWLDSDSDSAPQLIDEIAHGEPGLLFSGAQYLQETAAAGSAAAIHVVIKTEEITWDAGGDEYTILCYSDISASNKYFWIGYNDFGKVVAESNNGGSLKTLTSSVTLPTNGIVHITFSDDKLHINGSEDTGATGTAPDTPGDIGGDLDTIVVGALVADSGGSPAYSQLADDVYVLEIRDYNAACNVATVYAASLAKFGLTYKTSDYASLSAAVTAIGSNVATLHVDDAQTLTAAVTIPATCHVRIVSGGSIATAGYDLTIEGCFWSDEDGIISVPLTYNKVYYSGTAEGGSANTIVLDFDVEDDQLDGMYISITGGTSSGSGATVKSTDGDTDTCTMWDDWDHGAVDDTSTFNIRWSYLYSGGDEISLADSRFDEIRVDWFTGTDAAEQGNAAANCANASTIKRLKLDSDTYTITETSGTSVFYLCNDYNLEIAGKGRGLTTITFDSSLNTCKGIWAERSTSTVSNLCFDCNASVVSGMGIRVHSGHDTPSKITARRCQFTNQHLGFGMYNHDGDEAIHCAAIDSNQQHYGTHGFAGGGTGHKLNCCVGYEPYYGQGVDGQPFDFSNASYNVAVAELERCVAWGSHDRPIKHASSSAWSTDGVWGYTIYNSRFANNFGGGFMCSQSATHANATITHDWKNLHVDGGLSMTGYDATSGTATITFEDVVLDHRWSVRRHIAHAEGTAQSATASTIVLAAATNKDDDFFNGYLVQILSGTGAGQFRYVEDYTGATDTCAIRPDWSTTPDATSVYKVYAPTGYGWIGNDLPNLAMTWDDCLIYGTDFPGLELGSPSDIGQDCTFNNCELHATCRPLHYDTYASIYVSSSNGYGNYTFNGGVIEDTENPSNYLIRLSPSPGDLTFTFNHVTLGGTNNGAENVCYCYGSGTAVYFNDCDTSNIDGTKYIEASGGKVYVSPLTWDNGNSDGSWNTAANWQDSDGDNPTNPPSIGCDVVFDATSTDNCTLDTDLASITLGSITATAAYTGKLDFADSGYTVPVNGDITLDCTAFDRGNSTIQVTDGTYDDDDVTTVTRATAAVEFNGVCGITSGHHHHNLTVKSGATLTVNDTTDAFTIRNQLEINGAVVLEDVVHPYYECDTVINEGASFSGSSYIIFESAQSGHGLITLHPSVTMPQTWFYRGASGSILASGNYSDLRIFTNGSIGGECTFSAGTYTITEFWLTNSGAVPLAFDGSTNSPKINVSGNFVLDNNNAGGSITAVGSLNVGGDVVDSINAGTVDIIGVSITLNGTGAQAVDLNDLTLTSLTVNKATGTVIFNDGWTATTFAGTAGTFDPNGETFTTTGNFTIGSGCHVVAGADAWDGVDLTVGGDFSIAGSRGNLLNMQASATGYLLAITGTARADYVLVAHSDASGGTLVRAYEATDVGGNTNWRFVGSTYIFDPNRIDAPH